MVQDTTDVVIPLPRVEPIGLTFDQSECQSRLISLRQPARDAENGRNGIKGLRFDEAKEANQSAMRPSSETSIGTDGRVSVRDGSNSIRRFADSAGNRRAVLGICLQYSAPHNRPLHDATGCMTQQVTLSLAPHSAGEYNSHRALLAFDTDVLRTSSPVPDIVSSKGETS